MSSYLLIDFLSEILEYIENDFNSLYSCLLVSRFWCRIVIPILWKNPFNIYVPMNKNYQDLKIENNRKYFTIFATLYSCLPKESKVLISDNKIKIPSNIVIYEKPLFDYPRYCKILDTYNLYNMFSWITIFPEQNDFGINFKNNILGQEFLKLFFTKDLLLKEFILSAYEFNVHLTNLSGVQHTFSILNQFEASDDVS